LFHDCLYISAPELVWLKQYSHNAGLFHDCLYISAPELVGDSDDDSDDDDEEEEDSMAVVKCNHPIHPYSIFKF
jgi:hypothetical protein